MIVFELDIRVHGTEPPVRRTIHATRSTSLDDLHRIVQASLGWQDTLPHEFADARGRQIGVPDGDDPVVDEQTVILDDVLCREGDTLDLAYGGWDVTIRLDAFLEHDPRTRLPRLVGGARACPPDEVDGPRDYDRLLAALADGEDEDHDVAKNLLGSAFDPERFDLADADLDVEKATLLTWIGTLFPVPRDGPDGPWVAAWVDTRSAQLVAHDVVRESRVVEAALEMVRASADPVTGRPRPPDVLRLDDPQLAAALRDAFPDVEVVEDPLPELAPLREMLLEHVQESWRIQDAMSSYLAQASPRAAERFFAAAARLWRTDDWSHLGARTIHAPDLGLDGAIMDVAEDDDEHPGVFLVDGPSDHLFLRRSACGDPPTAEGPAGPLRLLFFEDEAHLPERMREEIAAHGWEVADASAHPKLLILAPDGTPVEATDHDLIVMAACVEAFASTSPSLRLDDLPGLPPVEIETGSHDETCADDLPFYDASRDMPTEDWQRLHEDERLDIVQAFHEEMHPHAPSPDPRLHAVMHVIAETLVHSPDHHARTTLDRLVREGLDRHDAIHAISTVVVEHIDEILGARTPHPPAYRDALDALTAESWRSRSA